MTEDGAESRPSERVRRRIERLLDEADEAVGQRNWAVAREAASAALALDPTNADAVTFLAAAEKSLIPSPAPAGEGEGEGRPQSSLPTSFVGGRYLVQRLLGEGATKRVYLAHDTKLDRDVAFALIKTDGLDTEGLTRIRREAQAMARLGDHPNIVAV